jgi:hypothetical protein
MSFPIIKITYFFYNQAFLLFKIDPNPKFQIHFSTSPSFLTQSTLHDFPIPELI